MPPVIVPLPTLKMNDVTDVVKFVIPDNIPLSLLPDPWDRKYLRLAKNGFTSSMFTPLLFTLVTPTRHLVTLLPLFEPAVEP